MKQHVIGLKVLNYSIVLRKEPEGGYTVIVPSLPGCITYGYTIEEAKKWQRKPLNYTERV